MDLGKRLQELRRERGYTQVKMQMLTGIDQSDYSKIERGVRNIKVSDLILIKALYDVDFSEFFKGLVPDNIPKLGQI